MLLEKPTASMFSQLISCRLVVGGVEKKQQLYEFTLTHLGSKQLKLDAKILTHISTHAHAKVFKSWLKFSLSH